MPAHCSGRKIAPFVVKIAYTGKHPIMRPLQLLKIGFARYALWIPAVLLIIFMLILLGSGVFIERVNIYPLLVLFHRLNGFNSPTLPIISLIGGFYLLVMFYLGAKNKPTRFSALLVLVAACGACSYLPPIFDTGWRELDSVEANGRRYYLAVYESASDGDFLYLYECDRFGIFCGGSLTDGINSSQSGWTGDVRLVVEDESLRVMSGRTVLYEHPPD
ncbi:MAG: hypothetical protein H7Y09_09525 [Chitinophagaceae bacterium]|nr:hypothetical protein [Anaerolineae bacterium]